MHKTIDSARLDSLIKNNETTHLKAVLTQEGYSLSNNTGCEILKFSNSYRGILDLSDMDVSGFKICLPSIRSIILNEKTNLTNTVISFEYGNIFSCEEFLISSRAILSNTTITNSVGGKVVIGSRDDSSSSSVNIEIENFIYHQDDLIKKYSDILGDSNGICRGFLLEIARLLKNQNAGGKSDTESNNLLYKTLSDSLSAEYAERYNDFVFMANVFQESQKFSDGEVITVSTKNAFNNIAHLFQGPSSPFVCLSFGTDQGSPHSIGIRTFCNDDGSKKYQIIDPNQGFFTLSTSDDCNNNLNNIITKYRCQDNQIDVNVLDAYQFIKDGNGLEQIPHPEILLFRAAKGETTYDFLKIFLEKGGYAYINSEIYSSTPINEAKKSQNLEVIELFLKYIGNDEEQKTDFTINSELPNDHVSLLLSDVLNNIEDENNQVKISGDLSSGDVDLL